MITDYRGEPLFQSRNDGQADVSGSLPSQQELIKMLKECRDVLVMCSLIDRSGQCKSLVDKVDSKMHWQ